MKGEGLELLASYVFTPRAGKAGKGGGREQCVSAWQPQRCELKPYSCVGCQLNVLSFVQGKTSMILRFLER